MRIAFDYTTGIYPGAGVARYSRSLVSALAGLDAENSYSLFYAAKGLPRPTPETEQADALFSAHPNLLPVPVPLSVRQMFALWQRLRIPLPVDRFTGPCDVMHSPDFVSPPHRTGADVITVHDLSFLVVPECADPKLAAFLGRTVPRAVRRADHIIAVSEQTRRALIVLLSVPPNKVTVAYNGVDARFRPMPGIKDQGSGVRDEERGARVREKAEALRRKLKLPERFILHVGTLEPRKNLKRLVEAYGLMVSKGLDNKSFAPHNSSLAPRPAHLTLDPRPLTPDPRPLAPALVLAGRKGWLFAPILEAVERVNRAGGHVVLVDYVYDEDLPLLYNMATVFAYPSIYEGFGLPAAEALACGVPTLVSNDEALSEVVGDAALCADAFDVEAIAGGLERLLLDDALRASLSAAGPTQVAQFTWENTARTVLDVYKKVAS
ncbi:MAG TPA: glycosyltransferase family 1 protein [Chloroflexia bacterium]|jgi:glycosyltransferase involved in cell wall biosynthesis